MSRFTLLVTAQAFRESADTAEPPVYAAGGEILYPPKMGPLTAAELLPSLQQADAVVASSDPYNEAVLAACTRLRVISRWGTGYDSVDLAACTRHGIVACNAPGLVGEAVADYVIMAMLAVARHLPEQLRVAQAGGWAEIRGVELHRKTVGLVGFGAIGKAVARRAAGFGCRMLAYDPFPNAEAARELRVEMTTIERVFAESDFVSLHAAVTPESRGMVNEGLLRSMPPHAYLVNAARGSLVDDAALLRALRENWIAGAALDAFTVEPLAPDHPFRSLPNCMMTPHSAFNTVEAAAATNRAVVENVVAVLRGERPRFTLNPEVYDRPEYKARQPLLP